MARVFLPMPCTALCWFILFELADRVARGGQDLRGTGPSYSNGMDVAAFVLMMFLGGLLQLCVGWPTIRRLRVRRALPSAYCRVGALVGIAVLMLPAGCVVMTGSMDEFRSSWSLIITAIVVFPAVVFYGLAGILECAS